MTIAQIQEEIIEEFSLFDNKNDSYSYIIEIGKNLPELPAQYRSEDYLIKGCQSQVWLAAAQQDGKVMLYADSDSTLVKGLVSLLVRVFSQQSPETILETEPYFVAKIGLQQMLSMNRSNGFSAMVKQIKLYALAYSA
jgi:cysteine desulfuration protein SufE